MSLVRVTCTLPADVLKAADALAKRLDRSRSWVVAEALRHYAADQAPAGSDAPARAVRERVRRPDELVREFDAARQALLDADFGLTPEERVHAAEEVARTAPSDRPRPRFQRVLQFDTYEDYLDWKRYADLEP